jgi:hypothetical protein
LTHLDGRQLFIKSNPGEVVKPGKWCEWDKLKSQSIFCLMPAV